MERHNQPSSQTATRGELCADGCGKPAVGYGASTGVPLCEGALASEDVKVEGLPGTWCAMTRAEVMNGATNSPPITEEKLCTDGCGKPAAGNGASTGVPLCEGALASEDFDVEGPPGSWCDMTRADVKNSIK